MQMLWFVPALAGPGKTSRVITTVSRVVPQVLLMLHTKIFCPLLKLVTGELGIEVVVTDAVPASTIQAPVPFTGGLALSV